MSLPQERRQPVLELLPAAQQTKVRTLLGYNSAAAGGLMGVDYLALPSHTPVANALDAVHQATTLQPEALATIYSLDPHGRLTGAVSLVQLLQADPHTSLSTVADTDPVRVRPEADLIEVTMLMTDYYLLALPVVDSHDQIIGVITIDDVLEANVPDNWRHREPAPRPAHHTANQPTDAGRT
jgi:Mg/Co/Ni transporter MgtE